MTEAVIMMTEAVPMTMAAASTMTEAGTTMMEAVIMTTEAVRTMTEAALMMTGAVITKTAPGGMMTAHPGKTMIRGMWMEAAMRRLIRPMQVRQENIEWQMCKSCQYSGLFDIKSV